MSEVFHARACLLHWLEPNDAYQMSLLCTRPGVLLHPKDTTWLARWWWWWCGGGGEKTEEQPCQSDLTGLGARIECYQSPQSFVTNLAEIARRQALLGSSCPSNGPARHQPSTDEGGGPSRWDASRGCTQASAVCFAQNRGLRGRRMRRRRSICRPRRRRHGI